MKRISYLILLAPSLFLITSCGPKAPVVDGISEAEARAFIEKNFKGPGEIKSAKVSWDGADTDAEKENVAKYISQTTITIEPKGNITVTDTTRLTAYISTDPDSGELGNSNVMGQPGLDAVAAMDSDIFATLYASNQNAPGDTGAYLTYKKEGKGLIIKSIAYKDKHTRVHTYDGSGKETKFEVDINKDTLKYKVTITFSY